jgi:hypothetical protein
MSDSQPRTASGRYVVEVCTAAAATLRAAGTALAAVLDHAGPVRDGVRETVRCALTRQDEEPTSEQG